ncbi:serine/threonine protein kinase [Gemmatimonadota bacterium]
MIGKTIDRYKIIDKLGEGGMGSVWKAEDSKLNRLVALKSLSPHLAENEEARERFIREAQAASALNHPNITTVHDLLDFNDQHFICMEYVEGKTIRDFIESGRVGVEKAIDIILQTAEALDTAHCKGILHRDVKSANIMVSAEGNVKIMDFGLAHLEERSQLTRTGTTMGTLAYSSPEQLTGRPYDERSEIWSLGVVFYELLAGQLPFMSSSEGELVYAIIGYEQKPLGELYNDLPEAVDYLVGRMLSKDLT